MTVFQPRIVDPDSSTDRGKVWRVALTGDGDSNEFTELVYVAVLSAPPGPGDDGKTIVYNHSTGTWDFATVGAGSAVDTSQLYYFSRFWR